MGIKINVKISNSVFLILNSFYCKWVTLSFIIPLIREVICYYWKLHVKLKYKSYRVKSPYSKTSNICSWIRALNNQIELIETFLSWNVLPWYLQNIYEYIFANFVNENNISTITCTCAYQGAGNIRFSDVFGEIKREPWSRRELLVSFILPENL